MISDADTSQPLNLNDAAVLGCVLTALCLQSQRAESFEAEKLGLQVLFAALILISGGWCWTHPRRWPALGVAVGVVVGAGALSTLVSISPAMSFFGAPERSQCWLSLLVGAVLCRGASRLSSAAFRLLLPLLCLITIALCLTQIAARIDPDSLRRLSQGAAAGNINYLAEWLGITLLFSLPLLGRRLRAVRPGRGGWLLLGGTALGLLLAALVITNSRAALISLGAAAMTGICLRLAVQARRRAARLLLLLGVGGLALAGLNADRLLTRFAAQDVFRVRVWDAAVFLVGRMPDPLVRADGAPDVLAGLRPWLGYGDDTLETLDSRYFDIMTDLNNQIRIDRMHNRTLDLLLMNGWIGLAAGLTLVQVALLTALRRIGLIRSACAVALLIGLQAGVGLLAAGVVTLVTGHAGMGFALGMAATAGGLWLWLLGQAAFGSGRFTGTGDHLLPAALVCILVHVFVNEQFSFPTIVTQTLVWLSIGLLLRAPAQDWRDAAVPAAQGHKLVLLTGLAALFGWSIIAPAQWILILTGLFGLIGWGWIYRGLADGRLHFRRQVLLTIGVWAAFALALPRWSVLISTRLNEVLLNPGVDAPTLILWHGLAVALGGLVLFAGVGVVLTERRPGKDGLLAAPLLMGAVVFYSVTTGSASLQRSANSLASIEDARAFQAADDLLTAASILSPWSIGPAFDRTLLWNTHASAAVQALDLLPYLREELLERAPFYVNARRYEAIRAAPDR